MLGTLKKVKNYKRFLLLISFGFALLVSLWTFWPTFQLELYGDEWESLWITHSSLATAGVFNTRSSYTAYETAGVILNVLTNLFGSYGTPAYVASFLFRALAAVCLYYFLTKNNISKYVALAGGLMFMLSPIGIQATDWAKNFTSYISIGLFLISLTFLYSLNSWRRLLGFLLCLFASIFINPVRAHGLVIATSCLVLFEVLVHWRSHSKIIRFLPLGFVLMLFISVSLHIYGDAISDRYILLNMIWLAVTKLFSTDLHFARSLFMDIGNSLIPSDLPLVSAMVLGLLFLWKRKLLESKLFLGELLVAIIPVIVILYSLSATFLASLSFLNGYLFSLFLLSSLMVEVKAKKFAEARITLVLLLSGLSQILIPWSRDLLIVYDYTHRYLIYNAIVIPLTIAFCWQGLLDNSKTTALVSTEKVVSLLVVIVVLASFTVLTKAQINQMQITHSQADMKVVWNQLTAFFNNYDFSKERPLVLVQWDDPAKLQGISFGLGYHLGLDHQVWDINKLPIAVGSREELRSMITDGQASIRHLNHPQLFSKNSAFYFLIQGETLTKLDLSQL